MTEVPSLAGSRVLLIAPRFFGYDEAIARELARRGAQVDAMPDRPFDSGLYHAAARFVPRYIQRVTERHYRRLLGGFAAHRYDYVIVVNGQTVSRRLVNDLRRDHPQAAFLFYTWDSLANRPGALALSSLFDRAYTFEREVAARHGMRFRPLFFDDHATDGEPAEEYDITFVGTAHTDRHRVIERLDATLPAAARRFWYLFIKARWVLAAYRLTNRQFRGARTDTFRFHPLSRSESQRVFESSRAILDIEHVNQTGLTMRTLEVLGAGKKLVTTNPDIVAYAFYDATRIEVIDRMRPRLSEGFLDTPFRPMEPAMRYRYSIAGWLDELLMEEDRSAVHLQPGHWPEVAR